MQTALVKLAAHMGGQGLAEPALEVTLVDVCQVIGQRAVEVSPTCLVVFLCCRLDVAHDLGDQLFALSVGLVPGVQERCPLQRVVVGLLVEFLRVAQEAGDVSIGQDAPDSIHPGLEAADAWQGHLWHGFACRVPGARQGEQGRDQFAPVSRHPLFQVVGKAAAPPGFVRVRIHADPIAAPRHVSAQLDVIAGCHPGGALGVDAVFRLAQDALLHRV